MLYPKVTQCGQFLKLYKFIAISTKQSIPKGTAIERNHNKIMTFEWIDKSFLSQEMREEYKKLLDERYEMLRAQ